MLGAKVPAHGDQRFRDFAYDELVARDKASPRIFWLRTTRSRTLTCCRRPDEVAAEVVESLEAALAASISGGEAS